MKLTFALQELLKYHQENSPTEVYQDLSQEIERLVNSFCQKLEMIPAGAQRARILQGWIEEQNNLNSHVKTSCYKGCGACCHLEVEITSDDAERLAEFVRDTGFELDRELLKEQALRPRRDEAWSRKVHSRNRCVFLGPENFCLAYEHRPMICRKHSVVSPASECLSENGKPVPVMIPMNEVILSAAINLPQNAFASLSKMLSQSLAKQENIDQIRQLDFVEDSSEDPSEGSQETALEKKEPDLEI